MRQRSAKGERVHSLPDWKLKKSVAIEQLIPLFGINIIISSHSQWCKKGVDVIIM